MYSRLIQMVNEMPPASYTNMSGRMIMKTTKEMELDEDEELLKRLVDLQIFDGLFDLTNDLAKLLGTDLDTLQASM
jgi:hypothetical protein